MSRDLLAALQDSFDRAKAARAPDRHLATTCCCESSPPEFGGNLPDRDCPSMHGDPDHHGTACVCLDCLDAQAQDDADERGAWERDEAVLDD